LEIEWTNKARKQIRKIGDRKAVERIFQAIEAFAANAPCDVKVLVNHRCSHRLRVGRYRVLMTVDYGMDVVLIVEVRKRDERTY